MNISPISFAGAREINKFAAEYKPLSPDEKILKEKAIEFAKIDVVTSSDGDYCWGDDRQKANEFLLALSTFTKKPSAFAYHVAVDSIGAEACGVACDKKQLKGIARDIAKITPEITKRDIYDDWQKLS